MMRKSFYGAAAVAAVLVSGSAVAAQEQPAAQKPAAMSPDMADDDTLKDRVEYRLETNAVVRKYDVDVKVEQGVAMLSGKVATAAQKAEAEKVARVDGVKRVESTIEVDPAADKTVADRIKNGLSKTGEKINDAWITTKVNWFFMGEDLLKGSDINVDTKDHVVTLKGHVASQPGKARAMELARTTEGVKTVVDQLVVRPTAAQ
jgi:hyperosmotically inducible protein